MALLATAEPLSVGNYVTVRQAAAIKNVSYGCFLMYLRNHNVPVRRIDKRIMVSITELEKYTPRGR